MKISEITAKKNSEPVVAEKTNPLYLGATEKVVNISPVLGSKPKKQKKLMSKFFGSS
jgi:hypothetical protein